jgi:hypothetical protein
MTILKEEDRKCEQCGRSLHGGRTDRRFCNDTCRNAFNRRKTLATQIRDHENLPEIFKIIKKNYEILKSYGRIPDQCALLIDAPTKQEGINSNFCTSVLIENGLMWKFCFERGWREFDDGGFEVIERAEQANI